MSLLTILALVSSLSFCVSLPAAAEQQVFSASSNDLEALEYTVSSHPHLPHHRLRARRPNLCEHVEEWSGYLDLPDDRHFYWHSYESRNDPQNDPVVLWLNGGPGCSSFCGMLQELGPCNVARDSPDGKVYLNYNPYSWSENATLLFLDQPVGTGYSYAERGDEGVWTTEKAAVDVHTFLQLWFLAFKDKFGNNDFHMAGESFAGRYIPVFADYVVQQNAKKANELPPINLKSVLIGNGMTNPELQYASYVSVACDQATGYGPYLNETTCEKMRAAVPKCQQLLHQCANNLSDTQLCAHASAFCEETQTAAYYETGRSAYDFLHFGVYQEDLMVAEFLNYPEIRHELGVDHEAHHGRDAPKEFVSCSDLVGEHFEATGDGAHPSSPHVSNLLESGVRALLYSGTRDFICNSVGNEWWTSSLPWSGQKEFEATKLKQWHVNGSVAGDFRTYSNLTFATVHNSGHFVPLDQPVVSLAMARAWLHEGADAFQTLSD